MIQIKHVNAFCFKKEYLYLVTLRYARQIFLHTLLSFKYSFQVVYDSTLTILGL